LNYRLFDEEIMESIGIRRLNPDESHFVVLSGSKGRSIPEDARILINKLGIASAQAQGLRRVITSFSSFEDTDNTIYILLDNENKKVLGFLRVGKKNLFLWDRLGCQHEINTLCLLDFFTCPECQRRGYGKLMIDRMLNDNHLQMHKVPIDRPSNLCLAFMKAKFGLSDYMAQANSFVVFDDFWHNDHSNEMSGMPKGLLSAAPLRVRPRVVAPIITMRTIGRRGPAQPRYNPITWAALDR
jgi:alpha-tubulin N-acetyltransferase 1